MKKILVPTDFSECAEKAIDFAVQTAKIIPAEITLLHSYEVTNNLYTDFLGMNREFNTNLLQELKEKLQRLKEGIEEKDTITVHTSVSTAPLQTAIKTSMIAENSDLIIMGTQGARGIKEKFWGSRTAATISRAHIPVLAIPSDYKWKKPQNILLATNQFEKDPGILNYIFELADLFMAKMQVAVFTNKETESAGALLKNSRKMKEYENFLKEAYYEKTLTSSLLHGENLEDALHLCIQENDIDLLIMVTYNHSFWNRISNPSKTKRMSYHTHIPLLAMPAERD